MKVKAKLYKEYLKTAMKNHRNVLVQGSHGNGKTEIALEVCREVFGKDRVAFFSGATMDHYIQLIGVPVPDKDSKELRFFRGNWYKTAEVLILDDFNRATKATRNAVMELVQFKTINQEPVPNLKCVVITINPFDTNGTYDVERMDPAQLDRFPIKMELSPGPDPDYFKAIFGDNGLSAVAWWKNLNTEVQKEVSARCLYNALEIYLAGLEDPEKSLPMGTLLPDSSNPSNLVLQLQKRDPSTIIEAMYNRGDIEGIRKKFENPDFMTSCRSWIEDHVDFIYENDLVSIGTLGSLTNSELWPNLNNYASLHMPELIAKSYKKFANTPNLNIDNFREPALRYLHDTYADNEQFYNHEAAAAGMNTPEEMLKWVVKKYAD